MRPHQSTPHPAPQYRTTPHHTIPHDHTSAHHTTAHHTSSHHTTSHHPAPPAPRHVSTNADANTSARNAVVAVAAVVAGWRLWLPYLAFTAAPRGRRHCSPPPPRPRGSPPPSSPPHADVCVCVHIGVSECRRSVGLWLAMRCVCLCRLSPLKMIIYALRDERFGT